MLSELLIIFFAAIFTDNFVLNKFLGICPFLGVSKKTRPAFGMGLAVTFVMVVAGIATYFIFFYLLKPLGLPFLQYVAYILVIASMVQLIEMFLKKHAKSLYDAFGIYLPLITTNCAILGLVLLNILKENNFIETIVYSVGAGVGFTLALILMSGIREKIDLGDVPESLKGIPIALIVAGLLALTFAGLASVI